MPSPIGNFFMRSIVNSPLHGLLGDRIAVITVRGRKSGRLYSTPINVSREGDGYTTVSLRSRTWWRNLRGGSEARLRVAGKTCVVRADVIESHAEVQSGLKEYFAKYPRDARYFSIPLDPHGRPDVQRLAQAADERVIIRFRIV